MRNRDSELTQENATEEGAFGVSLLPQAMLASIFKVKKILLLKF